MQDFVDREIATNDINTLLEERTTPWLVLSGGSKIGKTEFAKKIASMNHISILCELKLETMYACAFVESLKFVNDMPLETIIYEFSKQDPSSHYIYESIGFSYVSPLKNPQLRTVIKLLIKKDISSGFYSLAHYLGRFLDPNVKCIMLDDFHNCGFDSYGWLLEFWHSLFEPQPTIVVICNFDLDWESHKLLNIMHGIVAPISIEKFDTEIAFYDIIQENVVFESDVNLLKISKQLFSLFEGSSRFLFETIELLKGKLLFSNDEEKIIQIINVANQIYLNRFDRLSKIHMLVLQLLSFSPTPISKECIMDILEFIDPIATDIINKLYDDNFIKQTLNTITGRTLYSLSDDFLAELIKKGCSINEQLFFKNKIYRAIQRGQIHTSKEYIANLAIELNENEAVDLVIKYIINSKYEISLEKQSLYIDKLINHLQFVPERFISIDIAQLLYRYGYYQSAQSVINILASSSDAENYDVLILLGDIQHVLLSPEASHTYKKASEIEKINISDKLKALNRRIMALNQEHQERVAKDLYIQTFLQYESFPCTGLVELYRNSNNSFGYSEAMRYTLKGYFLAKELGEELEMNKCLHNICMLLLQYGHYGQPMENNPLGFEPRFEQVLSFFSSCPEYRHEQAYPLLDLGTLKMFEYAATENRDCLTIAKKYYSEAQLYAKSFYACHIAETGLLVVNSYLYIERQSSFVRDSREKLYQSYMKQKSLMEDYRVHRKVLLSLSVSAIISNEIQEAIGYLKEAQPYITGAETMRYNNLCRRAGCINYIKEEVSLEGKYKLYYSTDKFVPWLISFCH